MNNLNEITLQGNNVPHDILLWNRFNKLLEKHIYESRNLNFYSNKLTITPRKLNELSKKYSSISGKKYIESYLIEIACNLISNTSLSIKEISFRLGFTEPTNFNKFFKKHTKLTPLTFRSIKNTGFNHQNAFFNHLNESVYYEYKGTIKLTEEP